MYTGILSQDFTNNVKILQHFSLHEPPSLSMQYTHIYYNLQGHLLIVLDVFMDLRKVLRAVLQVSA